MAKEWRRVRGGADGFLSWKEPGQVVEGVYLGIRIGKFGDMGQVRGDDGEVVTFSILSALCEPLSKEVREGQTVRIEYEGERVSKAGRTFKSFIVDVLDEEDDPEAAAVAAFPPQAEDGHPVDDEGPVRTDEELPF